MPIEDVLIEARSRQKHLLNKGVRIFMMQRARSRQKIHSK